MKSRYIIGIAVVLLVVAGGALFLDLRCILLGMLRGESFYDGKPTSYWGKALRDADPATQAACQTALKSGGAEAVPVLVELIRPGASNDAEVRAGKPSRYWARSTRCRNPPWPL